MKAETIEIKKFRFFIIDTEGKQRSSTWETVSQKNDLYIFVNTLGKYQKISLHSFGNSKDGKDSQFGFTKSYRTDLKSQEIDPPPLCRWRRPDCKVEGTTQVIKILYPSDYLKAEIDHQSVKKKFGLQMASKGKATEVSVFYSTVEPDRIRPRLAELGFTPLPVTAFPNGEYAYFAFREVSFDAQKALPEFGNSKFRKLDGFKNLKEKEKNLHAICHNSPQDEEVLSLIEINGITFSKS
ncbi:MAG: hypothetical protein WD552_00410 [Candidatus Paceibacterota bacterium]